MWFKSTSAHNTITVDGQDSSELADEWMFKTKAKSTLKAWSSTEKFDYVDGSHDGFERLPDPVTHRRRIVFVKPAFWLVVDELIALDQHRYDQYWHFGPEAKLTENGDLSVRADYDNGAGILVKPLFTKSATGNRNSERSEVYDLNKDPKKREAFVDDILSKMTLDQKVGQCFTIHWGGSMVTPYVMEAVEKLHIGGIRVTPFGQNSRRGQHYHQSLNYDYDYPPGYKKIKQNLFIPGSAVYVSAEQYADRLNQLQALATGRNPGVPLHVSIDQEGDISRDFSFAGINLFPSAMGLTSTDDPQLAYEACKAVALQLSAIGVTNLHSPVLDVNMNPNNPEINIRAYGDDPDVVAEYALASIKGYMDGGLVPTAKHFPGRGDSDIDAHYAVPNVPGDWDRLEAVELKPYRVLIENGLPSVMLAHTSVPAADPSMEISTVSREIVTGLLRERLGFEGVITTDSITMGALMEKYGVAKSCALAIKAGCDLVLNKVEDEFRDQAWLETKRFVEEGEISETQLDASVTRVLTMKYNLGMFDRMGQVDADEAAAPIRDQEIIRLSTTVAEKCCTLLRDTQRLLPLAPEQTVMVIEQQVLDGYSGFDVACNNKCFNQAMVDQSGNIYCVDTKFKATEEDIDFLMGYVDEVDVIVATNYYWRLCPANNTDLIRKLIAKGKKVIVVTNCPYELGAVPEATTVICNYSVTPESLKAAARMIYGKLESQGQWMFATVLQTAMELGAPMVRVWAGSRNPDEATPDYRTQIADEARHIVDLAGEEGIRLVFEFHNDSLTQTGESCAALMEAVDHTNARVYWQPAPELEVNGNLSQLRRVLPWLVGLHVFHWRPTHMDRHPLVQGESDWGQYLKLANQHHDTLYALLEFVKEGVVAQFHEDAATLHRMLDSGASHDSL